MEDTNKMNNSFSEVKIYKPKPVRLYQNSKKRNLKSSLASSTSTVNSEKNMNQNITEETKIDLENISIDEINTDFFLYSQYLEEVDCQNEICDILNNSDENGNDDKENLNGKEKDSLKIKRCENPLKNNLDNLTCSYFDDLIEDFNNMISEENKKGEN